MESFSWQLPEENVKTSSQPTIALRRFRPAQNASLLLEGAQPTHLRSGGLAGEVVAQTGPYQLSSDWWDQQAWARTEWDVQLENGAVCRCHEEAGAWRVDGIYD
jgi:hypothetical protein